jgi:hypothetical protein
MKASTSWQASDSGYQLENFSIDWDGQQVTCPNGKCSSVWYPDWSPTGLPVIRVEFRNSDCKPCPARSRCTTSKRGRGITLRPQIEHETIQQARADQATSAWRDRYAVRHGIEGTISQAVRSFGLRRSRYRGLAKTRLQHLLTATAINLARVDAWTVGTPFASTPGEEDTTKSTDVATSRIGPILTITQKGTLLYCGRAAETSVSVFCPCLLLLCASCARPVRCPMVVPLRTRLAEGGICVCRSGPGRVTGS